MSFLIRDLHYRLNNQGSTLLGVGVISHQLVRIHINADRRWFRQNTHQREIYTSELAKPHVDAGFKKHAADRPKC